MEYIAGRLFLPGLLILCTSLAGCGLFASSRPTPPAPPSPVREFIISHMPGDPDATGIVSDPEFGHNLRIVLEQEFFSARGESCRRASLFSEQGETEMVVMCRDETGFWTMAPRVWGQGLPPASNKTASPPVEP